MPFCLQCFNIVSERHVIRGSLNSKKSIQDTFLFVIINHNLLKGGKMARSHFQFKKRQKELEKKKKKELKRQRKLEKKNIDSEENSDQSPVDAESQSPVDEESIEE